MKQNETKHELTIPPGFWWNAQGPWVEPINIRRGGESGVQRLELGSGVYYVKRQTNHLYRSLRYPLGRPTLHREWRNLQVCKRLGVATPTVVCFDMRRSDQGWEALLVTQALAGHTSLQAGLESGRWSAQDLERLLGRIVEAILPLHLRRRKHGHLYPKEIFIRTEGASEEVAFVDLEISRRVASGARAAQADMRRLCRSLQEFGLQENQLQHVAEQYRRHGLHLAIDGLLRPVADSCPAPMLNARVRG